VIDELLLDNDDLVLGDLNADPGPLGGLRATTKTNEQGCILMHYLRRWNYVSVHLHQHSKPSHTYISEAHSTLSSIDHILCPMHLMSKMQECSVLDEDPINMSDHLPVCAGFVCDLNNLSPADGTNKSSSTAFKPNWSKLSKQEIQAQYTSMVEDHLSSLAPLLRMCQSPPLLLLIST